MKQTFTTKVLALMLTIAALMVGQSAWAQTFTIEASHNNSTNKTTFTITRSGSSLPQQTINYRTVNLSAYAGQHYTAVNGTYTFPANETTKTVEVTENTGSDAYQYQNTTQRSYRFEVLDVNGFELQHYDRTYTTGIQFSNAKVSQSVTNLVTMSSGNFSSGMSSSKYLDVSFTPPTSYVEADNKNSLEGYVLIDDSYDYANKPAVVSTSSLINSTKASASYLKAIGYKIYATICFTEKERDDGYQYVQIIAGTSTHSYDGADGNGKIDNGPTNSVYKACFELSNNSNATGKAYFPHRGTGTDEFSLSTGKLWQQKYYSNSYDGNGSVILDPDVANITTRFDAAGDNNDTWGYKDFFVRMALCDATKPTLYNNSVSGITVSGGPYVVGNTFYISVPFSEIVHISGASKQLETSWGPVTYESGDYTNVITFKGTITANAGTVLAITSINNSLFSDLAGNYDNFTASTSFDKTFTGVTCSATYTLAATNTSFSGLADEYVLSNNGPIEPHPTVYFYKGIVNTTNRVTLAETTNYTLAWADNTSAGTGNVTTNGAGSYTGSVSTTFPIRWASYTLRLHHNDGTDDYTDQTLTYNTAANIQNLSHTGYTFARWTTNADGSGTTYTDGQNVNNLTATDGEVIDLYAQWTANTYTVHFDANNGSGTMSDMAFTYDQAQNLTANAFIRTGCTFAGWNTASDGTGDSYTDGQEVSNLTAENNGLVTLYAQWTDHWGVTNGADGTSEEKAYVITTTTGLDLLASDVNNDINEYGGTYFKLGNDIDYQPTTDWDDATSTEDNYTAIGNLYKAFCGIFDGQGHTVSGIRIYKSSTDYQGLFGRVYAGTVKNVTLSDARITGYSCVGGISGQTNGNPTIQDCRVLNTAITGDYPSAVIGEVWEGTLIANYYHGCTVNGTANATDVGAGYDEEDNITQHDRDGARSVHALTLGTNITATGESVTIGSDTYYASNTTVTLAYGGTVPEGYAVSYSYNDGSDHDITGNTFTMPASDATVSVSFTPITYSVHFDANGGTGSMDNQSFTYDAAQNLTANAFTLLGYKFGGWTTIADGTGDNYTNAQNVINLTAVDGATVTLYAQWVLCDWTVDNEGTERDPYMIYRSEQFEQLATSVNSGTTYSGKFFKLGDNITVSTMVGTSEIKSFQGTFDGDNKTMTLALTATSNNCAPFMYMKDATIRNLNIAGTISTGYQFAASIAAHTTGTTNIQHCTSTVEITSTVGTANSDGTHGGFVAVNDAGTLSFSNCVFAGKLLGANATCNGGFVGWNEKTEVNYTDCLFAPAEVTMGEANSATFNRNGKNTFTRTYYLTPFGEAQGNQVVSDVTAVSANKVYKPITAVDGNNYIAECDITCVDEFYIYTGSAVNVTPVVKCDNTLTVGTDYTVTIKDSDNNTVAPEDLINKGDYTLIVDGIGSCVGTQTFAFSIVTSVNLNGYDFVLGKDAEGIYYKIETTDDLNRLAAYVNSGNEAYGQRFMQTADIAYTHTTAWNDATSTEDNYTAIGNYSHAFCGIFDGQGHTVSGIRIHKSSTQYQGLFGRIYGESCIVKNVTLTDARIKGKDYIGGITGQTYSYPTIQDCLVLNAAISGSYCGAVIGRRNTGTITTSNYYHNCTVNGNTSNVGYESGDRDGVRSVHALTLGTNITATGESVTIGSDTYYASNTTVTLSYSGTVPEGCTFSGYTVNGTAITGNTFTMPAADATVSASLSVPYIDADGNEQTCTGFTLLTSSTGSTVTLGTDETESWYVVNGNVNITANSFVIEPFGAVHLILMDGATLTVQGSRPIDASGSLTIYGQSLGTGSLVATGSGTAIFVKNSNTAIVNDGTLTINGGNITATSSNNAIHADNAITINGGSVTALSSNMFGYGITSLNGDITINGGTVSATGNRFGISAGSSNTLTLGWHNTTDRIYASSYQGPNGILVKSGQAFTDGTNIYAGTLTNTQVSAIAGKTLQPVDALVLADNADNTSIINDHNGETVNVVLAGRTLYKDGAWNTLCLPFYIHVGRDIMNNADSPLHGATIMRFDTSASHDDADGSHRSGQVENGNLYLYFEKVIDSNGATSTYISAGEPFLVKWDGDGSNNIVNPVFTGVTVSNKTNWMNATTEEGSDDYAHAGNVTFKATYAPITFNSEDKSVLFMGGNNTLYYPDGTAATTINAFRAYFQLNGITAGDGSSSIKEFKLNFGEDDADGIGEIHNSQFTIHNEADAIYNLAGQRVTPHRGGDGEGLQSGIYIVNGRKVLK